MMYRDGEKLDADPVWPLLYQGSKPTDGALLIRMGFWVLVLCAKEYQPRSEKFPRLQVIHAPFDDVENISEHEIEIAVTAARMTARAISAGKKVLVTCQMGLNRSGLVSALTIHFLTGAPAEFCMKQVIGKRLGSLQNSGFRRLILEFCRPAA